MTRLRRYSALIAATLLGCAPRHLNTDIAKPPIIPHTTWQTQPAVGYAADATRRNKKAGDSLSFHDLTINVISTAVDSSTPKPTDIVRLQLAMNGAREERVAREG